MTTITCYLATTPVLVRALKNLSAVLKKGEAHAKAKGFDPAILLNARLAPDMFALTRQVQIAADTAKGAVARLTGQDPPTFADDETTFEQLHARIQRTIDYVESIPESAFAGAEDRTVTMRAGENTMQWQGLDYLTGFVLPNLYFHAAMAYAILRHNGVELGKRDFLAGGLGS